MMMRKRLIASASVGLTAGCPVLAQDGPPSGPWFTELEAAAAYQGSADLDGGGSVSISRGIVAGGVSFGTDPFNSVGVSVSAGTFSYNFDGVAAPFEDVYDYNFSLPIFFGVTDTVTALVIPTLRFSAEEGVDMSDAQTGGAIVGAFWQVSDTLQIGPGLGAVTTLEDGISYFPFLLVDWSISDRWNLSTGRGLGASRGPGLTLSYAASDELSLGIAGRYEQSEFRLDDDGPVPGGVGRDTAIPLVATLDWTPNPGISVNGFAGLQVGGNLTIEDDDGRTVENRDYDPSPIVGATVQIRF